MRYSVSSPDKRHAAGFIFAGEIRFGPVYYSLALDGRLLADRLFGEAGVWSPDSRFLAVQEWLSVEEAHGPQTALLCLDLTARRLRRLSVVRGGFITPLRFEDDKLIYEKRCFGVGGERRSEFEIAFAGLPDWQPLASG